eukprot:2580692-Prymnesium_polylepis.1
MAGAPVRYQRSLVPSNTSISEYAQWLEAAESEGGMREHAGERLQVGGLANIALVCAATEVDAQACG